jgi:hypothetical protein
VAEPLRSLVAEELAKPVDPRVRGMAAAIAALYPGAAQAVLFYGSCLRERNLDGLMLDFYLIVSDYRAAYGRGWLSFANRTIPPNVFPFAHDGLTAKYAVLSAADFARECGMQATSTSVWARFAQPSRLVWAADDAACEAAREAVAEAPVTLFQRTLPVIGGTDHDVIAIWKRGFRLTYGAELRAERSSRPEAIIEAEPARYARFGAATLAAIADRMGVGPNGEVPLAASEENTSRWWRRMQRKGKALTLLRLAKATTTFAGGIDYLAWKINRHAGTKIEITPWQRRHPILAGLTLLPRLLRRGAVR